MKVDQFVSVVAPIHNDADIIESFIADTVAVLRASYTNYEIVLVDDGSTDRTQALIKNVLEEYEGIRVLCLSRSFGEEMAISAGLEMVIGDYVIVMLAHMDPPEIIPELVEKSLGGIDIVFGVNRSLSGRSWLFRKTADIFFWYSSRILNMNLVKGSTQFRCLSRQAVNAIIQIKDSDRYLRLFSTYVGFPSESFDYKPIARDGKVKRRSFIATVNVAISLIIENSPHPLRLISLLGMAAAVGNLLYMGYIVVVYIIKEDVMEGWTTLSMQNAAQFFFVTLLLTAMSEYIGRILSRLRDRPLYYVMSEMDSSVMLVDKERANIVSESQGRQVSSDENNN